MSMLHRVALFAAAAFVTGADKADPEPPKTAPPKADIRGVVKLVAPLKSKAYLGRVTIEGKKEDDTKRDKAAVMVAAAAKVYKWVGGKKVEARFEDIKPGCKVQCDFTAGPATSVALMRTSEILILESPKE